MKTVSIFKFRIYLGWILSYIMITYLWVAKVGHVHQFWCLSMAVQCHFIHNSYNVTLISLQS